MNPADYPRCKTCRHWDNESVHNVAPTHGTCAHPANGDPDDDSGWGEYAFGGSYPDGYNPSTTGPDFGCVHWEAKDT